jgi:hypothetical protein
METHLGHNGSLATTKGSEPCDARLGVAGEGGILFKPKFGGVFVFVVGLIWLDGVEGCSCVGENEESQVTSGCELRVGRAGDLFRSREPARRLLCFFQAG